MRRRATGTAVAGVVAALCALPAAPASAGRYPLGSAADVVASPVAPGYGDASVLDFDGDGLLDLAVTGRGKLQVWLGASFG